MIENGIKQKWTAKAADSFHTKLSLFVYDFIEQGQNLTNIKFTLFPEFKISDKLVEKYCSDWQIDYDSPEGLKVKQMDAEIYEWMKAFIKSDIYKKLRQAYIDSFESVYKFEDFKTLLATQKECYYCGMNDDLLKKLTEKKQLFKKQITRGWTLEIDRANSNYEYTKDTTVMCCYWCNNAKTDEFTKDEFKYIIGKAIRKVWDDRLNS